MLGNDMDKETVIKINDLTSSIKSQEEVIEEVRDFINMLAMKKRETGDGYLTLYQENGDGEHLEVSNKIMMEAANKKLEIEIQELDLRNKKLKDL